MQDINIININNKHYRVVDPTKITAPQLPGKTGQALLLNPEGVPVWGDVQLPETSQHKPLTVYLSQGNNTINIDITSVPYNFVNHVYGVENDQETSLPLHNTQGIQTIKKVSDGDKTILKLSIGEDTPEFGIYNIYLNSYADDITITQTAENAVSEMVYYGYIGASTPLTSLGNITPELVEESRLVGYVDTTAIKNNTIHDIAVAEGCWLLILVPNNYSALIFDSFEDYHPFSEIVEDDNILSCNGTKTVTLENSIYRIYGKFIYVTDNVKVKIIKNDLIPDTPVEPDTPAEPDIDVRVEDGLLCLDASTTDTSLSVNAGTLTMDDDDIRVDVTSGILYT